MIVRKGVVCMAAAMLAIGSYARAQDTSPQPVSPTVEQPLTQALDMMGAKSMPIQVQGYIEAGYMYDPNSPRIAEGPTYSFFDYLKNRLFLDQADLTIFREPKPSGKDFDWGFTLEGGFGSDYSFFHSNGMMDNRAIPPFGGPQDQADIDQAYLSFNIPVLNGVIVNAGKFGDTLGYEHINPWRNALYSHSNQFDHIPATFTGVNANVALNSQWKAMAGITRGWNQSLKDTNGDPDFIAQVRYTPTKSLSFAGGLTEGPEAPRGVGPAVEGLKADDSDWWTLLDLYGNYTMSDQLSFGAGIDYGDAPHAINKPGNHAGQWYGIAGYAGYNLIKNTLTANARLEWYDDTNGFTLGTGAHASIYSATLGVTYIPFANDKVFKWLEIRPEIRYDYATKPIFDTGEHGQLNLASDLIMQF